MYIDVLIYRCGSSSDTCVLIQKCHCISGSAKAVQSTREAEHLDNKVFRILNIFVVVIEYLKPLLWCLFEKCWVHANLHFTLEGVKKGNKCFCHEI